MQCGGDKMMLAGAWAQLAWQPFPRIFGPDQINIAKRSGSNILFMALDKQKWVTNTTDNLLGIPFRNYLQQLRNWCSPEIKVVASLHTDSSFTSFGTAEKTQTIRDPTLRAEWIQWATEVAFQLNLDGLAPMDEPPRTIGTEPMTFDEYYSFITEVIDACQTVNSGLVPVLWGQPHWSLAGFATKPVLTRYPNALFIKTVYYNPLYEQYPYVDPEFYAWENAYYKGRIEEGKQLLYDWMDREYGYVNYRGIPSVGSVNYDANWLIAMQHIYQYCRTRLRGFVQWTMGARVEWNLLDINDYAKLSDIGRLWQTNLPTPISPLVLLAVGVPAAVILWWLLK